MPDDLQTGQVWLHPDGRAAKVGKPSAVFKGARLSVCLLTPGIGVKRQHEYHEAQGGASDLVARGFVLQEPGVKVKRGDR